MNITLQNSRSAHRFWKLLLLSVVLLLLVCQFASQFLGYPHYQPKPSSLENSILSIHSDDGNHQQRPFPPMCTERQLDVIRQQLPPDKCNATKRLPWRNECSFSYASRCTDATWMKAHYYGKNPHQVTKSFHDTVSPRQAVYVGCNKGMDAVNTLRMLSNDRTYDLPVYRDVLFGNDTSKAIEKGRCKQEHAEQSHVDVSKPVVPTTVHCIEAMPITSRLLRSTVDQLGWQKQFQVVHAAMGKKSGGTVKFPDITDMAGIENLGIGSCGGKNQPCADVPVMSLDAYVKSIAQENNAMEQIDFLSIDVEGFDFEVILGASKTLARVQYLEFEYNWKGPWKKYSLSRVIDTLRKADFICYWAGEGRLWRITDCFLPYYDWHFWSNVACVNRKSESLLQLMEDIFRETISAGSKIRYG